MASEWQKLALGDLTEWSSGGTPPKSNPEFWGGDIPWISASSMKTGRLSESDRTLTPEGLKRGSRLTRKGNVLLLVRGSELHKRIPVGIAVRDVSFNQDVKALCAKNGLDKDFLYYWLAGHETMLLSKVENTGIGAGKLDTNVLKNLPVLLPPRPEQRRIAHILGTLDDKIENNRKTAKTLEAMAQAIFQSWFVDFDPVRAKMAGESKESICKRLKLTPEILDLFPDRLVDSELGEIPEGWEVGIIGDLFGFQNGYAFKSRDWQDYGIPVIKIGSVKPSLVDMSNVSHVSENVAKQANDFRLQPADLVVGMTGYVGEVGLIPKAPTSPLLNQRVGRIVLTGRGTKHIAFAYCLMRQPTFKIAVEAKAHGTAQANVSSNAILNIPTVVPRSELRTTFDKLCGILFDGLLAAYENVTSISNLRDILLPKLISGEIRVPEAERLIENIEG